MGALQNGWTKPCLRHGDNAKAARSEYFRSKALIESVKARRALNYGLAPLTNSVSLLACFCKSRNGCQRSQLPGLTMSADARFPGILNWLRSP
jgi:hypothetical protein